MVAFSTIVKICPKPTSAVIRLTYKTVEKYKNKNSKVKNNTKI